MNYFNGKLFVFGEVLFDIYNTEEKLGGAPFNVAFNLHMQGLNPLFISKIGQDRLGSRISQFMEENGLSKVYLGTDEERETGRVQGLMIISVIIYRRLTVDFCITAHSLQDQACPDRPSSDC